MADEARDGWNLNLGHGITQAIGSQVYFYEKGTKDTFAESAIVGIVLESRGFLKYLVDPFACYGGRRG